MACHRASTGTHVRRPCPLEPRRPGPLERRRLYTTHRRLRPRDPATQRGTRSNDGPARTSAVPVPSNLAIPVPSNFAISVPMNAATSVPSNASSNSPRTPPSLSPPTSRSPHNVPWSSSARPSHTPATRSNSVRGP
ncbi:hypothetical protein SCP_1700010 [Sparassis crispa]|uniref:Uncharacterized protein n=1 Tax=Sparassis crispa TaxID=139825 RepID=A0A401H5F6_9APHY|nr:hypothetical protein SCP_1700010 [Sparassis crispa]GBE89677.1 hypothetical protein SCP_1700010 [Sparassis crispa]